MKRNTILAALAFSTLAAGALATAVSADDGDAGLLTRAQALFKPLPAAAEAPDRPVTPERVALGRGLLEARELDVPGAEGLRDG